MLSDEIARIICASNRLKNSRGSAGISMYVDLHAHEFLPEAEAVVKFLNTLPMTWHYRD